MTIGPRSSLVGDPVYNISASADPTINDDENSGYAPTSLWLNQSTGTAWICFSPAAGAAVWIKLTKNLPDAQLFIGAGSYVYNLPPNTKYVRVRGVAPGGGGGSGYCGSGVLGAFYGGGGAQAGSAIDAVYPVIGLTGSAFNFTIPAAGTGGAAATAIGNGNAGTAGGNISINSNGLLLVAPGGAGGAAGSPTSGAGGVASLLTVTVGAGGASAVLGAPAAGSASTTNAGGGGGAGGSVNLGTAAAGSAGGAGSVPYGAMVGGNAGAVNSPGSAGASVTNGAPGGGGGGGGGGSSSSGAGKAGGLAGNYGAGGGGGGATSAGASFGSGKGGDGGVGILLFTSLG